ncbi:hypothetical protein ATCC90586_005849 [Pythium insidiosum]|nr:hypothetical protein ATCC90586_005849 [Pythium insidiosum]
MCAKLERLMEACEEWGLSISLPKSVFGVSRVDYLGHSVSALGVKANPKNLEELQRLEFPKTLKGIQSFLGSLNFYHKFIEHLAVHAAALYEVTAVDLATDQEDHDRLKAAKVAFEALKSKLVEAPVVVYSVLEQLAYVNVAKRLQLQRRPSPAVASHTSSG